MNRVMIMGRLGQDPEVQKLPTGAKKTVFSIATSDKWKDKQGNPQEQTEWHNIEAWGKTGELLAQYLAKGRQVLVEGSVHTDSWDNKEGKKMYKTYIKVKNFEFIGSKSSDEAPTKTVSHDFKQDSFDTADIPF